MVISTYKTVASELGPEIAIEDDDNDENVFVFIFGNIRFGLEFLEF